MKNMKTILFVNAANQFNEELHSISNNLLSKLESLGFCIDKFDLITHPIEYCFGCEQCFSQLEKACVRDENFNTFTAKLLKADTVIFSAPVFFDAPAAILQSLLDKFRAYLHINAISNGIKVDNKKWAFVAVSEDAVEIIENVKNCIESNLNSFEWEYVGTIGAMEIETDIETIEESILKLCEKLDIEKKEN